MIPNINILFLPPNQVGSVTSDPKSVCSYVMIPSRNTLAVGRAYKTHTNFITLYIFELMNVRWFLHTIIYWIT